MPRKSADATRAVVNAFALGYFSAILRLRRDLPSAWRASALAVLSNSALAADIPPDPRTAGEGRQVPLRAEERPPDRLSHSERTQLAAAALPNPDFVSGPSRCSFDRIENCVVRNPAGARKRS